MDLGVVRVADDEDFTAFRRLVDGTDGWAKKFDKNGTRVWLHNNSDTETARVRMIKVGTFY